MRRRHHALVAVVAAAAVVTLIGGPATQASWTDTANSGTTRIQAGTLTGTIGQSGPASFPVGTGSNVHVAQPQTAAGIIPGVQGQSWTYTLTNSPASDAPATAALRLKSSSVTGDYAALRPYLRATVAIDGAEPTAVPAAAFTPAGLAHTVALPGTLRPGQNRTVSLRVLVPMTDADGTDIPQALRATRSMSAGTPATAFTMTNTLELAQAPENR